MKDMTPAQSKKLVSRWAREFIGARVREALEEQGTWPAALFDNGAERADRVQFSRELKYLAAKFDKGHIGGWFGSKAGRIKP